MAGSVKSGESNAIVEINVIPLVDIILVVLIIFMVAAPMVMKPKIDINLPKSTTAQNDKDNTRMKVVLGKKGELFVDDHAVSLEGLTAESRKRIQANPNTAALLVADKDSTLEMVTGLVDAIKTGGIQKVAFSIQKKSGG